MSEYKLKMPISLTQPRGSSQLNSAPALPPPSLAHAPSCCQGVVSAQCLGSGQLLIMVLAGMSSCGCRTGEGEQIWTPSLFLAASSQAW